MCQKSKFESSPTEFNTAEFRSLDRQVKRSIRKDRRRFNETLVQIALENNRSLKKTIEGTEKGRSIIRNIKDNTGVIQREKHKVLKICTEFYKNMNTVRPNSESTSNQAYIRSQDHTATISPITEHDVHYALLRLKYGKSPAEDGISTEAHKTGETVLVPHVTNYSIR